MNHQHLLSVAAAILVFTIGESSQFIIAGDGQFPYIVSMPYMDAHLCTGVILDKYHILIPGWGHVGNFTFAIHAGTNKNNPEPGDGTKYGIEEFFIHPEYSPITTNNIAIVRLLRPLQFSEKIQPIQISTVYVDGNEEVTVAGWLNEATIGLQYEKEHTITVQECQDRFSPTFISEKVICAITQEPAITFHGYGSAMILDDKLVGILNVEQGNVNIYARMTSNISWIKSIVYDLCVC